MGTVSLFKVFASLGVPGLALGVFYLLFRTYREQLTQLSTAWIGAIICLVLVLTTGVILAFAILFRPAENPEAVLSGFVESLPTEVQRATPELTKEEIEAIVRVKAELQDENKKIAKLQRENDDLNAELKKLNENFYVKMESLRRDISDFGGSINVNYKLQNEKKQQAICRIHEALQEIGEAEGSINCNGEATKKALEDYRKKKGGDFAKPTQFEYFTSGLLGCIIADHVKMCGEGSTG